jgi:hypothetical protein
MGFLLNELSVLPASYLLFFAGCQLYESDYQAVIKTGANQAGSPADGFVIMKAARAARTGDYQPGDKQEPEATGDAIAKAIPLHIGRYRIERAEDRHTEGNSAFGVAWVGFIDRAHHRRRGGPTHPGDLGLRALSRGPEHATGREQVILPASSQALCCPQEHPFIC